MSILDWILGIKERYVESFKCTSNFIQINGNSLNKSRISKFDKLCKQVPCENRNAYENQYGVELRIGNYGFFTRPEFLTLWLKSKELRDEFIEGL